jgi:hypothetical protein
MIIERLIDLVVRNRREVILTTFWIALVASVVIVSYYSVYLTTVWGHWGTPFSVSPWEGPSIGAIGIIALMFTSIASGYVIKEARSLIFAYSITMLASFLIAVVFSFCYIWFALNFQVYGTIPFIWEEFLYMALVIIFRMFVPTALFVCLLGAALGSILRVYIFGE